VKTFANTGFTALLVNVGLKFHNALLTLPTFWEQEGRPFILSPADAVENLARNCARPGDFDTTSTSVSLAVIFGRNAPSISVRSLLQYYRGPCQTPSETHLAQEIA
jgi:hypothetical protein